MSLILLILFLSFYMNMSKAVLLVSFMAYLLNPNFSKMLGMCMAIDLYLFGVWRLLYDLMITLISFFMFHQQTFNALSVLGGKYMKDNNINTSNKYIDEITDARLTVVTLVKDYLLPIELRLWEFAMHIFDRYLRTRSYDNFINSNLQSVRNKRTGDTKIPSIFNAESIGEIDKMININKIDDVDFEILHQNMTSSIRELSKVVKINKNMINKDIIDEFEEITLLDESDGNRR